MELSKSKESLIKKLFTYGLVLCAFFELLIIQYFNFFEPKQHMGIDASWEYLKLQVMTKVGGLFPTEVLSESTSPGTDKIFALMVPINRLISNIWVSFAVVTLLISIISIFVLWKLLGRLQFDTIPQLIVVNLFLCPYLSNGFDIYNDLGFLSCIHGVPGYQNTLVLLFILMLYVVSFDEFTKKECIIAVITLVLFFYKGLTSGVSIVLYCGTPAIVFVLAKSFLKNDIKELVSKKAIFLYLVNFAIISGRFFGGVLGYSYGESEITWTTAPDFFENLQHEFLGYMLLVGAVPGSGSLRSPYSLLGICYIFGLIIFVVLLVAVIYNFVCLVKQRMWLDNKNDFKLFGFSTIIVISVQFALLKTNAAQDIFETRYLLTALICGFIFIGYFIESLDDRLLFKQFGLFALAFAIVAMDLFSDYMLAITDNSSFKVDEVQAVIEQTDVGLVYFWEEGKVLLPTYEVIRVTDPERVYKSVNGGVLQYYGQYKYYDDSTEYEGPTALVIEMDNPAPPKDILQQYEQIGVEGNIGIYYCENNPIDLKPFWRMD